MNLYELSLLFKPGNLYTIKRPGFYLWNCNSVMNEKVCDLKKGSIIFLLSNIPIEYNQDLLFKVLYDGIVGELRIFSLLSEGCDLIQ